MNHPKFTCNHINQKQLADRWDLSERTLERWRAIGWGPLFLKIGGRVVYRVEDIPREHPPSHLDPGRLHGSLSPGLGAAAKAIRLLNPDSITRQ